MFFDQYNIKTIQKIATHSKDLHLDGFPSALLVSVMGLGEASAKVGSGMRSNRFGYYMKVVRFISFTYMLFLL